MEQQRKVLHLLERVHHPVVTPKASGVLMHIPDQFMASQSHLFYKLTIVDFIFGFTAVLTAA